MRTCGDCGTENPDDARFCANCGAGLGETCADCSTPLPEGAAFCPACGHAVHTETTAERRFLTVLFADMVGFTAGSDEADPEDVQARLAPYHSRLRQEIERYDGTVEKLMGDGVMAVFGVPTTHEDDPERAVRTALRIQAAVEELNEEHDGLELAVRIGINSGEAVVTTGGRGERIVGDVVNTASRLESIAPPGGVVVGETTYRATQLLIDYEEMDPVEVKGKSKPLPVWRAIEPRGRYGIDAAVRADTTPFVGRESEMRLLTEVFRRVVDEGSLQLVTIAANAGVGKSRLVNEFWQWADDQPEIVWWRQGRCLPYGEGITFWALGEIVKGQAGIRESDSPAVAREKLHTALEATTSDAKDRDWLAAHVGTLVGIDGETEAGERGEAFAAWRRFLEDVASIQPLVMVVEDLHWADAALVGFLEDLLIWSAGTPIMIVCTARPEMYQTHQGWGGGHRNSTTISLTPLNDEHIARLLGVLLDQAALPVETHETLLGRAGGNPLFAIEFVRMLKDRKMLEGRGRLDLDAVGTVPVPETLQSLIGSRLDVLSPDEARVIEDASVVGKVFWQGALETMTPDLDMGPVLRRLVAREWIRPVRDSSIDGEREYAFWHALTRDVAYGRIPRQGRARKHRAMAEWIEKTTGDRVADHAELLAHHYISAWELGAAASEGDDELRDRTIDALILSGDRARRLDAARSFDYYDKALQMMPDDDPRRARALTKAAEQKGEAFLDVPVEMLTEAAELALADGDPVLAGQAFGAAHRWRWVAAGTGAGTDLLDRAIELLESQPASEPLADAYVTMAGYYMMRGNLDEQLAWAQRGLDLLDDPSADIRARGLTVRGIARFHLGDVSAGMADLEEAQRVAAEEGVSAHRLSTTYVNLAGHTWFVSGPAAALEIYHQGIEHVGSRGGDVTWPKAETMWANFEQGTWDQVLATAEELIEHFEGGTQAQQLPWAQSYQALVHVWRGDNGKARALIDTALPRLREIADIQLLAPALVIAARIELASGDRAAARSTLAEYTAVTTDTSPVYRAFTMPDSVRLLTELGDLEAAAALAEGSRAPARKSELGSMAAEAILSEARGDLETAVQQYQEVADGWQGFGHVLEEGMARYGLGRSLAALGRTDEAGAALADARRLFERLGARPMIDKIDEVEQASGM